MASSAPPPVPPLFGPGEDRGPPHLRGRLGMLWLTVSSILITVWFCTLGPWPAVIALVVEKHVLVALLVMRLEEEAGADFSGKT